MGYHLEETSIPYDKSLQVNVVDKIWSELFNVGARVSYALCGPIKFH